MTSEKHDPYRCEICATRKVVPALARDCEMKHLREEYGDEYQDSSV
jgi:hypothetical protein